MKLEELEELHYITPIDNVPSICKEGILCRNRATKIEHATVAMSEILERRARVAVPQGRKLFEYVNLYICARNPMLFKRKTQHRELCVLRVSPEVLDLEGVVVTDQNASSDYVRFAAGAAGLRIVNREATFAEDWTDEDQIAYFRKKSAKCAEVLVPDRIDCRYLKGAYVSCDRSKTTFDGLTTGIPATVDGHIFFL